MKTETKLMNYEGKSKRVMAQFMAGAKLFRDVDVGAGVTVRFYPTHPFYGSWWCLYKEETGAVVIHAPDAGRLLARLREIVGHTSN